MALTDDQLTRYARHILLPEIGGAGQAKIIKAKVLVVGAGGLGSPVILYLVAAGVGNIGIVDDDIVDLSEPNARSPYHEPGWQHKSRERQGDSSSALILTSPLLYTKSDSPLRMLVTLYGI